MQDKKLWENDRKSHKVRLASSTKQMGVEVEALLGRQGDVEDPMNDGVIVCLSGTCMVWPAFHGMD